MMNLLVIAALSIFLYPPPGFADKPRYQLTPQQRQALPTTRVIFVWDALGKVDSQGVTQTQKKKELKKFLSSLPTDRPIIVLTERTEEPEQKQRALNLSALGGHIREMGWDNAFLLEMAGFSQTIQNMLPAGPTQTAAARGLNLAMYFRAYFICRKP